jgi:hypothetical protein
LPATRAAPIIQVVGAWGKIRQKSRNRKFRQACWVLSLTAVALCSLFPLFFLGENVRDASGALPFNTHSKKLSIPQANYYGSPVSIYSSEDSDFCITLGFLALNPAGSFANFSILLDTTQQGLDRLQGLAGDGYNTVLLTIKSNVGLSPILLQIPFTDLQTNPIPSCTHAGLNQAGTDEATTFRQQLLSYANYRTNQNIFVLGQPRAFPNDWYELTDSITAYAIRAGQTTSGTDAGKPQMQLPSSLFMMSRDEDFSVRVAQDGSAQYLAPPTGNRNFRDTHLLMLTVRRPKWFILYTYLIGIMPFLLLLILGMFQWKRQKDPPKAYEVAFGVGATMVAILPLHAVLVPAALPGLTRLDLVFSTEIALLVGLSIIAVAAWTRPETSTRSDSTPGKSGTVPGQTGAAAMGQDQATEGLTK